MPQKILIIQTAFIGDALLSIPLLKNLNKYYPNAELSYLCRAGIGEFLEQLKLVKTVHEIKKQDSKSRKLVMQKLKSQIWDWIICPHESVRSQFICHSLKAKRKTSYKKFWGAFTFDELIERPLDLPEALRTLALLQNSQPDIKKLLSDYRGQKDSIREIEFTMSEQLLDLTGLKNNLHTNLVRKFRPIPSSVSMEIARFTQLRSQSHQMRLALSSERVGGILKLAKNRKIFVLAPGSVWETKIWRREYFREVCKNLAQRHFVVLIGGPPERELCSDLLEGLENVYNAAGETSLWESAEILACSDQVLTNDSGAMHLASLSSANVLSIFGPTVLEQGYRPWNDFAQSIESSMYCRPCGKHGAKKCPLSHHACMKLISPNQVLELIDPKG